MPIILDHQLREKTLHDTTVFPITFYRDELEELPDWAGPLHWHPDFEIATAQKNRLDYQVGEQHILLDPGDSIFVNGNMIHRISQLSGEEPEPMPNIVFSGVMIAQEPSAIYQKYIYPVMNCDELPFVVFRHDDAEEEKMNVLIREIYESLEKKKDCYEMTVQRNLCEIFKWLYCNLDHLTCSKMKRIQIEKQIRIRKMIAFIEAHYSEKITLEEIADSANISRTEAGRCFQKYVGCSPIEMLIQCRLQNARRLMHEKAMTIQEISAVCGFRSPGYFSRKFKEKYGYSPGKERM